MGKSSFKDSLKALEADIQHANTLALDYPRENDGARLQMRLSYSPVAHLFLFLVQWTDCHLAGALGMLRILIYMTYADGKTTMSVYERKASIKEFYAMIFPSLLQFQRGITDLEDRKQREVCTLRYKRKDVLARGKLSEADIEREEECGICMEMNSKVVLPNCSHTLCLKCYQNCLQASYLIMLPDSSASLPYILECATVFCEWRKHRGPRCERSQSCPFCRDSIKSLNSNDLWVYVDNCDIVDLSSILRENRRRLFMYIDKLPLVIPDPVFVPYASHVR